MANVNVFFQKVLMFLKILVFVLFISKLFGEFEAPTSQLNTGEGEPKQHGHWPFRIFV